jgi:hypothetical protein
MPRKSEPKELSVEETAAAAAAEIAERAEKSAAATASVAAAHAELVQAHHQAEVEYHRQASEAYFDLIDSQQKAYWKAIEPVEEARRKYIANCSAPQTQENWQICQDAYQELVRAESDFANNRELRDEIAEAHAAHWKAHIEAVKKAQGRAVRAYWAFLDALKEAGATSNE